MLIRSRTKTNAGFTLLEVIVALAVVALAATALVRLQLISIRSIDQADVRSRALLLAESKLAELRASDQAPQPDTGEQHDGARQLRWEVSVAPAQHVKDTISDGLYRVTVSVTWPRANSSGVRLETLLWRSNDAETQDS